MRTWLKEIREEKGINQAKLATKIGSSRAGYTNIENGKRKPSVELAKKIGCALGFEWTRFFEEVK